MAETKLVKVPDGKGGWIQQEVDVHEGKGVDKTKQSAAQAQAFIDEAGALVEKLTQYHVMYAKDHGLTKEHVAWAAALYCVNLRESYPDGPEAFDTLSAAASKYYDENA